MEVCRSDGTTVWEPAPVIGSTSGFLQGGWLLFGLVIAVIILIILVIVAIKCYCRNSGHYRLSHGTHVVDL